MSKINLRKTDNFITDLYKHTIKNMIENDRGPQTRLQPIIWPSEASAQCGSYPIGECKRSMFYKILGVTPTEQMSVTGRGICDAGLLYEDYQINKFQDQGILISKQIKFDLPIPDSKNNVHVHGKMDCLIEFNGERSILEIKSISEFKAGKIMGSTGGLALPAPQNLMQAMLYKFYIGSEQGSDLDVDNVYLMYINRGTGGSFYYKVDLDEDGYPILTSYDQAGKELNKIELAKVPSLDDLIKSKDEVDSDVTRLAELRINIKDIFSKTDQIYANVNEKVLPEKDYTLIYSKKQLDSELKLGRISKQKYNDATKRGLPIGDPKCQYCSFRTKCMADSGITMK